MEEEDLPELATRRVPDADTAIGARRRKEVPSRVESKAKDGARVSSLIEFHHKKEDKERIKHQTSNNNNNNETKR